MARVYQFKLYKKRHEAAGLIQKFFRRIYTQRRYQYLRSRVIEIQRWFRTIRNKRIRMRYESFTMNLEAVTIQKYIRG